MADAGGGQARHFVIVCEQRVEWLEPEPPLLRAPGVGAVTSHGLRWFWHMHDGAPEQQVQAVREALVADPRLQIVTEGERDGPCPRRRGRSS
jgi:hypothetical protein